MKRLFFIFCGLLLSLGMFAQSTQAFSYQSIIRDADNNLVKNAEVGMYITLMQGAPGTTNIYNETQTVTTNENGLLTTTIGNSTGFSDINWTNPPYFLTVYIDLNSGTDYTIEFTTQLLSVPFALHAISAESITGELNETDPAFNAWDKTTGIEISESQISDLQNYLTEETDPAFGAWNKSTGITITEAQITDLKNYLETENQNLNDVLTKGADAGNKNITNLATPVNAKDAATKEYVDALRLMILDLQAEKGVTDSRDGTHYNAVRIGYQVWMAENLKYLPSVNPPTITSNTEPCYYVYGYDGTSVNIAKNRENYITYGVLYNWPAAMNGQESSDANPSGVQGVCPKGWHLPSHDEWKQLTDYLGGGFAAGGKLKETSTTHWNSPNTGATNETGFTALPGGCLSDAKVFDLIGLRGQWWSTSFKGWNWVMTCFMGHDYSNAWRDQFYKMEGFSVRCVRD
ncbi:fibrobacter succinogenes major paralogous domain-containing protein [Perlabentimonas gracilis]|uniref:fibrobacter succinogenes major paralogous domain-containing protein n=1 Tax=Perlabentimonas gracilis TaxID=2715279 RepID=UPI00140ABCD5|nr:fibrobacter succinogenes major paralogous domain-containing protein [Perlabentimonas gracilis]NHB68787.1 hypothetical protein [Perlabentimonas gracilis]